MTNFLGWEPFSNGGSTVGPLGQCILQNFLNVVQSNVHKYLVYHLIAMYMNEIYNLIFVICNVEKKHKTFDKLTES